MRFLSAFSVIAFALIVVGVALAADPLDGTEWKIKLTSASVKTPSEDQIRFEKGTFASNLFGEKGFALSNYTLTEQKGQPLVWETMQTSKAEGTLSWRGEVGGESVKGVASWQPPKGTAVDYSFSGTKVAGAVPPAPAEPEAPAPAPKPKTAPKVKAPAPKPKKSP